MDTTTEIRKVPTSSMFSLAQILEATRVSQKSWKILMSSIKNENDTNKGKYSLSQINLIEEYSKKNNKLGAEILFGEWGTSGRSLPTLGLLWDLLVDAELYRAADYVAINILGQPTKRKPTPSPPPVEENGTTSANPMSVPYDDVDNACKRHATIEIGRGAFGRVFKVKLKQWSTPVAVKQLQNDNMSFDAMERQFSTEVNALSMYRHPNLVQLLGFASKESSYCLVYELLNNGSLEERLALEDKQYWHTHTHESLHWKLRLNIVKDVAEALVYLHTSEVPLIHRDVKTANILLSHDFTAKLGDFGLVRFGFASLTGEQKPNSNTTSVIIGTSAYMAPETNYSEVTELVDTFSFGVVLFEILSALPPTDDKRACSDLISHMLGECGTGRIFPPFLDLQAGDWGGISYPCAQNLYKIAVRCIQNKEERPTMQTVLDQLNTCCL